MTSRLVLYSPLKKPLLSSFQVCRLCQFKLSKCYFATETSKILDERDIRSSPSPVILSQITFSNTENLFLNVKTSELIKSGLFLTSMRLRPIFQHSKAVFELSQKILGKSLMFFLVRHTLFSHFCGGETLEELIRTGRKLAERNLGAIIDYAAEAEDTAGSTAVSYTWLDNNVNLTKEGIKASAELRDSQGQDYAFLALKVTSMCQPKLCRKVTACLNLMHSFYSYAVGLLSSLQDVSIYIPKYHDQLLTKHLTMDAAEKLLQTVWADNLTNDDIQSILVEMQSLPGKPENQDSISYIQWMNYFTPERIATFFQPTCIKHLSPSTQKALQSLWLNDQDSQDWIRAIARIDQCVRYAVENNVRLLVDAEQTFFQSAIDYIAIHFMQNYCKLNDTHDNFNLVPGIIYNTYQFYLKNAMSRILFDVNKADILGYKFSAKVVRGAYMLQEQRCAEQHNHDNPVHDTVEDTHAAYTAGVDFLMKRLPKSEILCGTHNEKSILTFGRKLGELSSDDPKKLPVTFAQLYGMCDYMSLQLGRAGVRTYKYLPYGPLHLVLPYLIRRAEENSSIFGSATKEARLVWKEVNRRLLTSIGL